MQDIVYVVAKLQARAGKEEALRKLIEPVIEPTRQEKGCRRYSVMQDRQNPAVITLLEEWDTEADLDTHLALPHLQKIFAELKDVLGAPPDIVRYKEIG
ncbi:putative quinol monooxygenase [Hyalangium sp.]|uniref:putative quinol monooxygenase n=1 Tax=Hyalangium sp. TaxID=2028555 RepID=UPI002D48AC37|nr:putative quinol monooxygenase [Hyalangium sp.]HYI01069.1 putative quinol monooxygenase [Hyalangium sp.]